VSTYVFFGLAAVYGRLAFRTQPPPELRLGACFSRRLALASATFLVGIYFFVRTFARWG
jgi:hypothetical protein